MAANDPDGVKSRRTPGRRMFGDYPVTDPGYWIWLSGVIAIGFLSTVLMFAIKG